MNVGTRWSRSEGAFPQAGFRQGVVRTVWCRSAHCDPHRVQRTHHRIGRPAAFFSMKRPASVVLPVRFSNAGGTVAPARWLEVFSKGDTCIEIGFSAALNNRLCAADLYRLFECEGEPDVLRSFIAA